MKKCLLLAALLLCTRPAFAANLLTIVPGEGTTSHRIEKSRNGGPFTKLVDLTMPEKTYTDTDTPPSDSIAYRVVPYQGTAQGVPSAPCTTSVTVSASTLSCKPAP